MSPSGDFGQADLPWMSTRWFFQMAYAARVAALSQGREAPLFRALVFRKLKACL